MIRIARFLNVKVGAKVFDFAATTTDGQQIKLSDLRGKLVLLDFWATWCAPCIAEIPNIKKVHDRYAKDGRLVVIGISVDADKKKVPDFVKKHAIPWAQIALGPAHTNPLAKEFGVTGVPATFLIGRDGKLVARDLTGARFASTVAKAMRGAADPTRLAGKGTTAEPGANTAPAKPYLGALVWELTAARAESLGFEGKGAVVNDILPDSPAAEVGLKKDDIITRFGEEAVAGPRSFAKAMRATRPGTDVEMTVVRDSKQSRMTVRIVPVPKR